MIDQRLSVSYLVFFHDLLKVATHLSLDGAGLLAEALYGKLEFPAVRQPHRPQLVACSISVYPSSATLLSMIMWGFKRPFQRWPVFFFQGSRMGPHCELDQSVVLVASNFFFFIN